MYNGFDKYGNDIILKGPAHRKNENLHFTAPAQTKLMQPFLVPCEAPFRSNLQFAMRRPFKEYKTIVVSFFQVARVFWSLP